MAASPGSGRPRSLRLLFAWLCTALVVGVYFSLPDGDDTLGADASGASATEASAPGRIEVVEIPTEKDIHDNINVYWVPDKLPPANEEFTFSYRMNAYGDDPSRPPAGRATATRREKDSAGGHRFVVDFEGKQLEKIPADDVLRAVVSVTGDDSAKIASQYVIKNPATGGWRLGFEVAPVGRTPLEVCAYLDKAGSALTETWSYSLIP